MVAPSLLELRLYGTEADLTPLAGHPRLRSITLEGAGITGHEALAQLPALEEVIADAVNAPLVPWEQLDVCRVAIDDRDLERALTQLKRSDRTGALHTETVEGRVEPLPTKRHGGLSRLFRRGR